MKLSELKKLVREVIKEQRSRPTPGGSIIGATNKPPKPQAPGTSRLGGEGGNKAPLKGDRPNMNDFGCGTNPHGPGCPGYDFQNCCQQVFGQSPVMQIVIPGTPMYGDMPCYTMGGQYLGDVTAEPVNGACGQTN